MMVKELTTQGIAELFQISEDELDTLWACYDTLDEEAFTQQLYHLLSMVRYDEHYRNHYRLVFLVTLLRYTLQCQKPVTQLRMELDSKQEQELRETLQQHQPQRTPVQLKTISQHTEEILQTVLWEQGYNEIILANMQVLRKQGSITYDRKITIPEGETMTIRDLLGEGLWCVLVDMYGEYGVTMRSGWITNKKGFFRLIYESLEE